MNITCDDSPTLCYFPSLPFLFFFFVLHAKINFPLNGGVRPKSLPLFNHFDDDIIAFNCNNSKQHHHFSLA
jgi:hypothetical protein